ncbi:hypothetical protein B0H11DRAFT_2220413 [Mycena galericulata]|nr:hypothetical protein B0H11DRAFT_2220413 [Mycena galericulata]
MLLPPRTVGLLPYYAPALIFSSAIVHVYPAFLRSSHLTLCAPPFEHCCTHPSCIVNLPSYCALTTIALLPLAPFILRLALLHFYPTLCPPLRSSLSSRSIRALPWRTSILRFAPSRPYLTLVPSCGVVVTSRAVILPHSASSCFPVPAPCAPDPSNVPGLIPFCAFAPVPCSALATFASPRPHSQPLASRSLLCPFSS